MKKILRENGLTITLVLMFLASWVGQFWTGLASYNEELSLQHQQQLSASQYLVSGHFIESTLENWESEFLQMVVFVLLTVKIYQRGSAESNPLPEERASNHTPMPKRYFKNQPLLRKLYENSLSLVFAIFFLLSFLGHLYGGWKDENLQRTITDSSQDQLSLMEFFKSSDFWFQSFQNWQSEFLSIAMIVAFTIFLRQKGSAQSKEVDSPHWQTEG